MQNAERYLFMRNLPELVLGVAGIPCVALPKGPHEGDYISYADCDKAIDEAMLSLKQVVEIVDEEAAEEASNNGQFGVGA